MLEAPRFELKDLPQDYYRHLLQMEGLILQHLDLELYHLIKLRASQINGCAYCLAMHTDEALKHGETPERIVCLDAWAGIAALFGPGARRARLDGGADADRRQRREQGSVRRLEATFHRPGDPVADLRGGADQRLEPNRDQHPRPLRARAFARPSCPEGARARLNGNRTRNDYIEVRTENP